MSDSVKEHHCSLCLEPIDGVPVCVTCAPAVHAERATGGLISHPDPAEENPEFTKLLATICTQCKTTYLPDELHTCLPQTLGEEVPPNVQRTIAAWHAMSPEMRDINADAILWLANDRSRLLTALEASQANEWRLTKELLKICAEQQEIIDRADNAEAALEEEKASNKQLVDALDDSLKAEMDRRDEILALQSASVLQKEELEQAKDAALGIDDERFDEGFFLGIRYTEQNPELAKEWKAAYVQTLRAKLPDLPKDFSLADILEP